MANKTITFGADLLPNSTSKEYNLGSTTKLWNIYGELSGTATYAKAAGITSTANGIAYYSSTTGTLAGTGAGTSGQYLKSNGSSAPTWESFPSTWTPSSHSHGNISNTGTLANTNRLMWTKDSLAYAGYHYASTTAVAINSTAVPSENFYVYGSSLFNGSSKFNIGTDDGSAKKNFVIYGNSRFISFGGQGFLAYNGAINSTTPGELYILNRGGDLFLGSSTAIYNLTFNATTANINWTTASVTGTFTFKTSGGFKYAGIGTASNSYDIDRPIWIMDASSGTVLTTGTPVTNSNFTFNAKTNTLKVGTGTLTATEYSGKSATAGTVTITTHTNTTSGNKTYYLPFLTATSGNLSPHAHSAVYLYETVSSNGAISKYDFCFGASTIKGSITLWDGSSHYGNIRTTTATNGLTAYRTYDLPDASGTIALAENFSNVTNNATLNSTTGTLGDIIYWSAANTPARLGIGADKKILKSNGETPEWADEYKIEIIRL